MIIPETETLLERPVTNLRAGAATAAAYARKRRGSDVSRVNPASFAAILDRYSDDTVFVHAGLSDVKTAFDTDPYVFLRDALTERFESVLAPGFTPSFKQSGVFHREYTRPQYGTFSRLFLADADHRTDDPIHSILVKGPYRFGGVTKRHTFGPEGPFAKLRDDDVLYINIGVSRFHCSQLHFVECLQDVPYVAETDHEGVVYHDAADHKEVVQTNFTNKNPYLYAFNREKIRRRLEAAGVINIYDLNGLPVSVTRAGDVHDVLEPEVAENPFYLVS